jgi:hypothetical protein
LYDFPRHHPELGELAPDLDRVVEAVQRRDRIAVMASGELAANQLGLSEQVPMRAVYLSSGRSKRLRIGRREIRFVQRAPREMATAGRPSATVIQALHYLGEERVDESVIAALRRRFTPAERLGIARDARHAPDWVAAVMRRLAAGESVADA